MPIGEKIKAARIAARMTQADLAKILSVAYQNIGQWESGKRNPKLDTIFKIADALGVRVEDLVGLETFDTGAELSARIKETNESPDGETLTVIHTKDPRKFIDFTLNQLNDEGKIKAAERVAEVAEVPRYRKDAPKD